MNRRAALMFCLSLFLFLLRPSALAAQARRTLAPGVELTQEAVAPPEGPLLVNVLRIDPRYPGIRLQCGLAKDVVLADDATKGREPVGALAARHGALAAINADFFPYTGDPLGLAIRDGELLSESMPNRAVFGVTAEGRPYFDTLEAIGGLTAADGASAVLAGINRLPGKNEIVALTPVFGNRARAATTDAMAMLSGVNLPIRIAQDHEGTIASVGAGDPNAAIAPDTTVLAGNGEGAAWLRAHARTGDRLKLRFDLAPIALPPGPPRGTLASRASAPRARVVRSAWTDVTQAVGGGPWLVRDGKVAVDGVEEGFPAGEFVAARHPRTAVGVTADGVLLLVTVDGRQPHSRGLSLPDMAQRMLALGAVRAINLDGGGSSAMVAQGLYLNAPSDGEPRAIADALLVYADAVKPAAEGEETVLPSVQIRAGERMVIAIPAPPPSSDANAGTATPSPLLWGTREGTAFVDQQGALTGVHAGTGTVIARGAGRVYRCAYTIVAGAPARLRASFTPVANNPPDRSAIVVRVLDSYGNPVTDQEVRVQATGGTPDHDTVRTDAQGRATVEIVWDVERGRRVTVSSSSLAPINLSPK